MPFQILLINSWITLSILITYSVLIFLVARIRKDNSVMDIAYGPAFFTAAIATAYFTNTEGLLPAVLIGCIALWSLRLSVRIFRKNFGNPEDARYAAWREEWMKKGRAYFLVRSYLQVNLLQILIILFVSLPAIIALSYPGAYSNYFLLAGTLVFFTGLLYETIADWQLDAFIARKKAGTESADLMTQGLFKYSRRPNYFGETLIWWGLAIMVLPLPFGYLGLISPLLITYIVTKVTGPMLEKSFLEKYPEKYQKYVDTTNYFIPLPPKMRQP
jgi:steroid 5-alpha reductase family enzyme